MKFVTNEDGTASIVLITEKGSTCIVPSKFMDREKVEYVVRDIKPRAFSKCKCKQIVFKEDCQIQHICDEAFEGNLSIESIDFAPSIITIGNDAFYNCENLSSVKFPDDSNLKSIGNRAFALCNRLESIIFPPKLEYISGFSPLPEKLKHITFPPTVKCLHRGQLQNIILLKSVTFSQPHKNYVFNDDGFLYTKFPAGIAYAPRKSAHIFIRKNIQYLWDGALSHCRQNAAIVIASKILKSIGKRCLEYSSMKDMKLPKSVESIEEGAFSHTLVNRIDFEKESALTNVQKDAFLSSRLTYISLPRGVTEIKNRTFYQCSDLIYIQLSPDTTKIGDEVFFGCMELKSIEIPASVKSIGEKCFWNCKKLVFTFPKDSELEELGRESLGYCAIKSITFPKKLKVLRYSTLFQNSQLVSVDFAPDSELVSVESKAICYNQKLQSIVFPETTKEIAPSFISSLPALQNLKVPSTIETSWSRD